MFPTCEPVFTLLVTSDVVGVFEYVLGVPDKTDVVAGVSTYVLGVPDNPVADGISAINDGDFPTFARLSTSLFRCFLIAFTSSASAAALYCSLISDLANARASASGDLLRLVSGMYTSTCCPPSCFMLTIFV